MAGDEMARDTWIFRTGLAVLMLLPLVVFLPLATTTGVGAAFFFLQMVLVASWVGWFARRTRRAQRDAER